MAEKRTVRKKKVKIAKAYNNREFLNSPPARIIRVLSEMVEPAARFRKYNIWNTVVFFGSARTQPIRAARRKLRELEKSFKSRKKITPALTRQLDEAKRDITMARYYEDAARLSEKLTRWFMSFDSKRPHFRVCTGGGPGIMEAANLGAIRAGGESVGLNISLPTEQEPNPYQNQELAFEFHYFFIRKFWFFYLAKALIVFPGGFGTLDELFELLTIIQTGKSHKYMPVILYGNDYWNEVMNIDNMVKWGTISKSDLKLFKKFDDVDETYEYLKRELTEHYVNDEKYWPTIKR
jgi:uncharacterized protein (TIGR00730 family)